MRTDRIGEDRLQVRATVVADGRLNPSARDVRGLICLGLKQGTGKSALAVLCRNSCPGDSYSVADPVMTANIPRL